MKYSRGIVTLERSAASCRIPPQVLSLKSPPLAPVTRSRCTITTSCRSTYTTQQGRLSRKIRRTAIAAPIFSHRRYSSPASPHVESQPSSAEGSLKRTALYDLHVAHGGKMVPFAGYSMPVQYSDLSVGESHKWTREKANLFDVGHMVQHLMTGSKVADFLEVVTPSSVKDLRIGHSTLSCLLHPSTGGIVDDLMISRVSQEGYYLVTNAGCRSKDETYISSQLEHYAHSSADLSWNILHLSALVALQGPLSSEILDSVLHDSSVRDLYFGQCRFMSLKLKDGSASHQVLVSRGGYTGEDGFEISMSRAHGQASETKGTLSQEHMNEIVQLLLDAGGEEKLRLAGLGARDSLRLEAGMCLYGHDLDDCTTPVEAALSWIIPPSRRKTGGFNGAETILQQLKPKKEGGGVQRRRIGLIVDGAPAREGAEIIDGGGQILGKVTSGCPSPTLGKNIAMGYVKDGSHKVGTELGVLVRKQRRRAIVTKMPFVPAKYWKETKGTAPG